MSREILLQAPVRIWLRTRLAGPELVRYWFPDEGDVEYVRRDRAGINAKAPEVLCACRTFALDHTEAFYENGFIHTADCCPDKRLKDLA